MQQQLRTRHDSLLESLWGHSHHFQLMVDGLMETTSIICGEGMQKATMKAARSLGMFDSRKLRLANLVRRGSAQGQASTPHCRGGLAQVQALAAFASEFGLLFSRDPAPLEFSKAVAFLRPPRTRNTLFDHLCEFGADGEQTSRLAFEPTPVRWPPIQNPSGSNHPRGVWSPKHSGIKVQACALISPTPFILRSSGSNPSRGV